jgi:hypothetical protein
MPGRMTGGNRGMMGGHPSGDGPGNQRTGTPEDGDRAKGKKDGPGPNMRQVLVREGDDFVPRMIKIGLSNFKEAIVLSGLQEGDVLGVPMWSRLKAENERIEERIRSSRSFGTSGNSSNSRSGGR